MKIQWKVAKSFLRISVINERITKIQENMGEVSNEKFSFSHTHKHTYTQITNAHSITVETVPKVLRKELL